MYFLRNHKETIDDIYLLNPKINISIGTLAVTEKNKLNFFKNTNTFKLNFYRISYETFSYQLALTEISQILYKIINCLNEYNVAYNIVFTCKHIFIFPRKHETLCLNQNFAYIELIGILVFFDSKDFDLNMYQEELNDLYLDDKIIFFQINEIIENLCKK